jgi:hypothetical protein
MHAQPRTSPAVSGRNSARAMLLAICLAALPAPVHAQDAPAWRGEPSRVIGLVVEPDRRNRPLRDVSVRLSGPDSAVTLTTRAGRFEFAAVAPGEYVIEATHIGYQPVQETLHIDGSGRTYLVELRLATQAIALEPITVTVAARRHISGDLAQVYDRIAEIRKWGFGTAFDREDIEKRNASRFNFLLDNIPGVRVERSQDISFIMSTRASSGVGGPCVMAVYLDGQRIVQGGAAGARQVRARGDVDLNRIIAPSNVEAIEVYNVSDRIPAQFWDSHSGCGVVLIWSRRSS